MHQVDHLETASHAHGPAGLRRRQGQQRGERPARDLAVWLLDQLEDLADGLAVTAVDHLDVDALRQGVEHGGHLERRQCFQSGRDLGGLAAGQESGEGLGQVRRHGIHRGRVVQRLENLQRLQ